MKKTNITLLSLVSLILTLGIAVKPAPAVRQSACALYDQAVHSCQTQPAKSADIQREIVLLETAYTLDKQLTSALQRLVNISMQLGRYDIAENACRRILGTDPNHATTQMQLIQLRLAGFQTVQAKQNYLNSLISDRNSQTFNLRPETISDIYRKLAELAWQSYDTARAEKFLQLAVKTVPQNLKAQQLLTEISLRDEKCPTGKRYARHLHELLAGISANPLDIDKYYDTAVLAGNTGFKKQMQQWIKSRNKLIAHFDMQDYITNDQKLQLAEAAVSAGAYEFGKDILTTLLKQSQNTTTQPTTTRTGKSTNEITPDFRAGVHVALAITAQKLNDRKLLKKQEDWITQQYRDLTAGRPVNANASAICALYCAVYAQNIENPTLKALKLANHARRSSADPPRSAIIAGALAYADGKLLRDAKERLAKLDKNDDALATLAKATVLIDENKKEQAGQLLEQGLKRFTPGPVTDELRKLWKKISKDPVPKCDLSQIENVFDQFDQDCLMLPYRPDEFLELTIRTQGSLSTGRYVRTLVKLTNSGTFPVSLGPVSAIEPSAILQLQLTNSESKPIKLSVPLNSKQIIAPGETIAAAALLSQAKTDDGTCWRKYLANHAKDAKTVKISARVRGRLLAGKAYPVNLLQSQTKTAKTPGPKSINYETLSKPLQSKPEAADWNWAGPAGLYLLNRQTNKTKLIKQIIDTITAKNKSVKQPLAFVLRYSKPDANTFNSLSPLLQSDNWLTRLITLDTIGQLQGPAASQLYKYYAQNDSQQLVRQLATSYLMSAPQKNNKN